MTFLTKIMSISALLVLLFVVAGCIPQNTAPASNTGDREAQDVPSSIQPTPGTPASGADDEVIQDIDEHEVVDDVDDLDQLTSEFDNL